MEMDPPAAASAASAASAVEGGEGGECASKNAPEGAPLGGGGAPAPVPLNKNNWMNLVAYILNAVITYGIGVFGGANAETNEYLSLKYQTLVTPAGWAFSIWALIFLSELCFAVGQMTPQFRDCRLVQHGVRDWFAGACAAQIVWTVAFSYEHVGVALLSMLGLCYLLVEILRAQYAMADAADIDEESVFTAKEYWLFRFPFELHGGWVMAASFVNFNVWLVSLNSPTWLLITAAGLSLLGIVVLAAGAVWYLVRPNFPVGAALTWATIGIAEELSDPKQSIFNSFTYRTIDAFQMTSAAFATILCIAVVTRGVKKIMKDRKLAKERREEEEARNIGLGLGGGGGGGESSGEIASDFVKVEDDKGFVKVDAEQV